MKHTLKTKCQQTGQNTAFVPNASPPSVKEINRDSYVYLDKYITRV